MFKVIISYVANQHNVKKIPTGMDCLHTHTHINVYIARNMLEHTHTPHDQLIIACYTKICFTMSMNHNCSDHNNKHVHCIVNYG